MPGLEVRRGAQAACPGRPRQARRGTRRPGWRRRQGACCVGRALRCPRPRASVSTATAVPPPIPSWSAGLCITTVVSYLSHSQVWAAQAGSGVMVGGSTNRAKVMFERELGEVLGAVPEVPPAAPGPAADGGGGGSGEQAR